ncbi:MAG TPA: cytochrome c [Bryobacteraceae bacterium]|nr:cytochrome c [Bryobacteraceae bacterium]
MTDGKFCVTRIGAGILALGALLVQPCLTAGDTKSVATQPQTKVTFAKDIAPIFQAKCEECHRNGSMAPMSLVTYEETRPWAKSIRERVIRRQMPPWHLDKTVGIQKFANDRSLSDAEIDTIVHWVDAGSPQGNPKDMPAPKVWPNDDGWILAKQYGPPDLVIKSEPYTVKAQGQDQWWKPWTEIPITEARWVRAVEMRPGTPAGRRVTHHALARLIQEEQNATVRGVSADDTNGAATAGAASGGLLMEWAVGKNYDIYRPNTGKLLLPGSRIWWDIHYHSVGEQVRDHVELAVYLYPKGEVPKYRTYLTLFGATPLQGGRLDIPPNTVAETQGFHVLARPARLENFQPHMHLRGKAMSMEAILPDGTTEMLSYVNNFNFNWMNNYIYAEDAAPVLPKGTIIHVTAWHDNTRANPANPDPDQWVGYGDRTVDEMAHAWVNVTYISDEDYKEWAAQHKPKRPGARASLQ